MAKRFSLSNVDQPIRKNPKDIDKIYKKTKPSKYYLAALFTFVLLTIIICSTPFIFGKHYDYKTTKLNEKNSINETVSMSLSNMEINREKGIFKAAFSFTDGNGNTNVGAGLSNITCDYKLQYVTSPKDNSIKKKIVKVSDNYTIVYFENIPKDFEVLKLTVTPKYINPKLASSNGIATQPFEYYANDKDLKDSPKLAVKDRYQLFSEERKNQIDKLNASIEKQKKEITTLQQSNALAEKDLKKEKAKLQYQTESQREDTNNTIASIKQTISTNNEQIKGHKAKIKELQQRIENVERSKGGTDAEDD